MTIPKKYIQPYKTENSQDMSHFSVRIACRYEHFKDIVLLQDGRPSGTDIYHVLDSTACIRLYQDDVNTIAGSSKKIRDAAKKYLENITNIIKSLCLTTH